MILEPLEDGIVQLGIIRVWCCFGGQLLLQLEGGWGLFLLGGLGEGVLGGGGGGVYPFLGTFKEHGERYH